MKAKSSLQKTTFASIVLIMALAAIWWSEASQSSEARRDHTEKLVRDAGLSKQECQIMLRAKAEIIPIEIERSVLLGVKHDTAASIASAGFENEKVLCEKYGIIAGEKPSPDVCEKYPGIFGC